MNFYAFIPREDGEAPVGTDGKALLSNYKTAKNAVIQAKRRLRTSEIVVFSYRNFYDDETFTLVYNGTKHKNPRP